MIRGLSIVLVLTAAALAVASSPMGARLWDRWRAARRRMRRRRDERRINRDLRRLERPGRPAARPMLNERRAAG